MTGTLSARTSSGAAGLLLAYVAALLAVTNLIFSAGATAASTPLPGTVVRTGTYGINLAAAPAASLSAPEEAPVIATPPVLRSPDVKSVATPGAQEQAAGASDQVSNNRREGNRRPQAGSLQGQLGQYHRDEEQAK